MYMSKPEFAQWGCTQTRFITTAFLTGVLATVSLVFLFAQVDEEALQVRTALYNPGSPVAVVGGGMSGLTAAWLLRTAGRTVHVFEAGPNLAGQDYTWKGTDPTTGQETILDLKNTMLLEEDTSYSAIASYFGVELHETAFNVSSVAWSEPWDNAADAREDPSLEAEIRRFLTYVHQPPSFVRSVTPLWLWLLTKRFSQAFIQRCLLPTLSVLLLDSVHQSAQSVLDAFKPGPRRRLGLRYDGGGGKVRVIRGGSTLLWDKVRQDVGDAHFSSSHEVSEVVRDGGTWTLHFLDGTEARRFSDVIMAVPPQTAAGIVRGVGSMISGLLNQVGSVSSYVTLHTDSAVLDKKFSSTGLYLIDRDRGYRTTRIGRVFGNDASELLLTVHDDPEVVNREKVIQQFMWSHHVVSLWDKLITRRFLALLDGDQSLHYAGDWSLGVGTEDSIRSGVYAACKVGLPKEPETRGDDRAADLYAQLVNLCSEA